MKDVDSFFKNAHLLVIGVALAIFFSGYAVSYKQIFQHNAHAWLDYAPSSEQFIAAADDSVYTKTDDVVVINAIRDVTDVDMLAGLRLQIGE